MLPVCKHCRKIEMRKKYHSELEVDDALFECEERLSRLNPKSKTVVNLIKMVLMGLQRTRAVLMRITMPTEDLWPPKR